MVLLTMVMLTLAATPVFAQSGGGFCVLPEGCDLDGDGTPETPSGAPVLSEGQYDDGVICLLPEGCDVDEDGVPEVQPGAPVPENTQEGAPSTIDSPVSDAAVPANKATSAGEAAGINVLPETGGAFSIMAVAGSLLVGGGLLVRRLTR